MHRDQRQSKQPVRYDAKTQAVFDVFGTYLVDVFYNNHYVLAKERVRNGLATSITDEYRILVVSYIKAPGADEKYYKKLVISWHEYYRQHAFGDSMLLPDFQDKILSQFIPPGYYRDFSERQKDDTFRAVVMKTLVDFGDCILAPDMLRRIIDDHNNRDNVLMLQGRIETILVNQRDVYYAQFARQIVRSTIPVAGPDRMATDMLNAQLDKLKQAYIDEKRAHCELRAEHERAQNIIKALMTRLNELSRVDDKKPARPAPTPAKPAVPSQWSEPASQLMLSESSEEEEPVPNPEERRAQMLAGRTAPPPSLASSVNSSPPDDDEPRNILDDDTW